MKWLTNLKKMAMKLLQLRRRERGRAVQKEAKSLKSHQQKRKAQVAGERRVVISDTDLPLDSNTL